MRVFIYLILFISMENYVFAQTHFNKEWSIGSSLIKLNFKNQPLTIDTLPQLKNLHFYLGHSNICDSNGNLILVSDGYNVYDSMGNYIDGGDTLASKELYAHDDGFSTYSQASLFLPMGNNQYYLITNNATDSVFLSFFTPYNPAAFDELLLHKIDMNANGGLGKKTTTIKLLEHDSIRKVMMMACRHANGKDWWLVKQMYEWSGTYDDTGLRKLCKNKIAIFLITKDSIVGPKIQYFPEPTFGAFDLGGQAMFSQDGTKYASTCRSTNKVFIAEFDRCTGIMSNGKAINIPNFSRHDPSDTTLQDIYTQGVCFSPNGQFLYVNKFFNLLQLDLSDNDSSTAWYHIAGLDTTWAAFQKYSSGYCGPDGKLYVGNWWGISKQMSVINNPNVKGAGCDFCPRCLRSQAIYGVTSPPCMPNYDLGAEPCWPLANEDLMKNDEELEVYPNPASTTISIRSEQLRGKKVLVSMYNIVGQEVLSNECYFLSAQSTFNIKSLQSGVYLLKVGEWVRKVVVE